MGLQDDVNAALGIVPSPSGYTVDPSPRRPRPRGVVGHIFDYLDRPRASLSESIQAAGAGEDVLEAAWRGLIGEGQYGTLGEALFPGAKEKGFQPSDVGAFAVDVATDPLLYLGPSILKGGAKLALKGAKAFVPPVEAKLAPLVEAGLTFTGRQKALRAELRELGLSKKQVFKRLSANAPGKMTWEDFNAAFKPKGKMKLPTSYIASTGHFQPKFATTPKDYVNFIRANIRDLDINFQPVIKTSLHALTQSFGRRILPAARALKLWGPAGTKAADKVERATIRTRINYSPWEERLVEMYKGVGEGEQVLSSMIREKLVKIHPTRGLMFLNPAVKGLVPQGKLDLQLAAKKADELGGLLDDFKAYVLSPRNRDPWGRGLQVVDSRTGKSLPLEDALIENYFPRRYSPEQFTTKGREKLRQQLLAGGMPETMVDRYIRDNLAGSPRRVGHLEYARTGRHLNYEHNPMKVMPKYLYDAVSRVELLKEFGVKNEILNTLMDDVKRMGAYDRWIDNLTNLIIGRNPYDKAGEKLLRGLNTLQSISKLGYQTTVANSMQAPFNQSIRSGFTNAAKSILGTWAPTNPAHKALGPAAFSRGIRQDVLQAATGGPSRIGDAYLWATGFNWSEKAGRHVGAIGGWMEADEMAKTWARYLAAGNTKQAGRMASELARKYRIPEDILRRTGGRLPNEILEESALRASDTTMHAFGPMDLPVQWRDPFWRMILQFKSFIYKQTEFMAGEVLAPGITWLATDGAKGAIGPMLRTMAAVPMAATTVVHLRDIVKSIPSHLWALGKDGRPANWNYKDPFWEDPDPWSRFMTDAIYLGTLGLVGDMFEAASRGRMADWLMGPTVGEGTEIVEALAGRQALGKVMTRLMVPGAVGLPSKTDLFKELGRMF